MMSTALRPTSLNWQRAWRRQQKSVGRAMQSHWHFFKLSIAMFFLNYLIFSVSFAPRPCFPVPFCSSPVCGRSTAVGRLMKRAGWTIALQLCHLPSVLAKKIQKNPKKSLQNKKDPKKIQAKDSLCAAQEALSNECVCDLITHLPKMTLLILTEKKKAEQHYCSNTQSNYQVFIFQCTQLLGENKSYSLTLWQSCRKPCASPTPMPWQETPHKF